MSESASNCPCESPANPCSCSAETSCQNAAEVTKPYDAYHRIEKLETSLVTVIDYLRKLHNVKVAIPAPDAPPVDPDADACIYPTDKIAYLDMSPLAQTLIDLLKEYPPVHTAFPNKSIPNLG